MAFSPDGRSLASVGLDGTLRLWDVSSGAERFQVEAHSSGVLAVAFSFDGKTLATCSATGAVKLFDPATGNTRRELHAGKQSAATYAVWSVAFSPDGKKLVTGHGDKTVRQWDAASGKELRILGKHPQTVWGVAYSPDGKVVASCARRQGVVRLWAADTGALLRLCPGPRGGISRVVFSQDGKYLAAGGSFDPTNFLWDAASGKEIQRFSGHEDYVDALALTPDAKLLASADRDGLIRVWQTATGKELKSIHAHPQGTIGLSVAPDGMTFASGASGDALVRIWDLKSGRALRELPLAEGGAAAVAFSPDGKTLALAAADSSIRLVERASGNARLLCRGQQRMIHALAFARDGRRLASAGADGTTLVWDVTGLHPVGQAVARALSAQELSTHWRALADHDAPLASRSLWTLVAHPGQSVAWLETHLKPASAVDPKRIAPLLAKLDAREFAVRDEATRELEAMDDQAESALRKALEDAPSLEVRRRLERLIARLESFDSERLRSWRALEVLEHIGTPAARTVLEVMARGAPKARLTQEAGAALERLAKQ